MKTTIIILLMLSALSSASAQDGNYWKNEQRGNNSSSSPKGITDLIRSNQPRASNSGSNTSTSSGNASNKTAQEWYDEGDMNYFLEDFPAAVKCYQKAADMGLAKAQYDMGYMLYVGKGISKDQAKAVQYFIKAARQGHPTAQFSLGYCYYNGTGIDKDYNLAVEWYRKSANQNYPDAQNSLGDCYYWGRGLSQDYTAAVEWYRKAAEQDCGEAQFNLGFCYWKGKGLTQNTDKAIYWLTKASENEYEDADEVLEEIRQSSPNLDNMSAEELYRKGNEYYDNEDYVKAVDCYQRAADMGYASAQNDLGYCYDHGKGVEENKRIAVIWYRKAAEQNNRSGQSNLGYCYYNGTGVPQDYDLARFWFEKAAANGSEPAKKMLEKMNASSTSSSSSYSDASATLSKGLVAYYSFEDNLVDRSGHNNTAHAIKGYINTTSYGVTGKALQLRGIDSPNRIVASNNSSLRIDNAASFSIWFNLTNKKNMDGWGKPADKGLHVMFSKNRDWGAIYAGIDPISDGKYNISFAGGSQPLVNGCNVDVYGSYLNTWNHAVFVITSRGAKIYLNGKLVKEVSQSISFASPNTKDLYIGSMVEQSGWAPEGWYPFYGNLDEFRMYNRELSLSEIQYLYNNKM